MNKFLREFKEFISCDGVMNMVSGITIATAFGMLTTSFVNDMFMPFIGWLSATSTYPSSKSRSCPPCLMKQVPS